MEWVNEPLTDAQLQRLAPIFQRRRPLGDEPWTNTIAARLGLQYTLNPLGRPAKKGVVAAK
jgi:REP-associated tyrosine transposase